MKIVTIIGARPQFIKAASLSAKMANQDQMQEIIVHTGQHFDQNMSDIFFDELNIPAPKYNLGINSLSHGAMTGRMLEKIETIVLDEKPDWLLVYGDTNSTLAGALAAQKLHIPVAHVEAGLRSYNDRMPEEINRVLTDRLSSKLFCPTENAKANLLREGIPDKRITITGDIMQDSVNLFKQFATPPEFDIPERFILGTLHRQENTDDKQRLHEIISAYNAIGATMPIVLPLHPRTKKILANTPDVHPDPAKIIMLPPVSYWKMLWLLNQAALVITDSGGLQKEAYFNQKFCITTRDETEWTELVEAGVNTVTSANKKKITEAFRDLINKQFTAPLNLYGNGNASEKIMKHLIE